MQLVHICFISYWHFAVNAHAVPDNGTSVQQHEVVSNIKHQTDTRISDDGATRIINTVEVTKTGDKTQGRYCLVHRAIAIELKFSNDLTTGYFTWLLEPNDKYSLFAGGVNYIRWGRTTCPDTEGIQLLYSGVAAGTFYSQKGGGSEYLCLPNQPEFLGVTAGHQDQRARVYGAEYEAYASQSP